MEMEVLGMKAEAEKVAKILGLGSRIRTMKDLDRAVHTGLPQKSVEHVVAAVFTNKSEGLIYKRHIIPDATWKRRQVNNERLSVSESEKAERLARVFAAAEFVLEDRNEAQQWLVRRHPELENKAPVEVAQTEIGARRVEEVLSRLLYGLPV
jgi:putative toxin-antitoxin system antitoxin component (TIGR02293 family)